MVCAIMCNGQCGFIPWLTCKCMYDIMPSCTCVGLHNGPNPLRKVKVIITAGLGRGDVPKWAKMSYASASLLQTLQ